MAKLISGLVDRLNFAIKKGLSGYYAPDKITNEVHAESLNLWREYIKSFEKTRTMDPYLKVFQRQEIVQLSNGLANYLTQDYIYLMEGFNNPTITKLQDSVVYTAPSTNNVDISGYSQGFSHWIVMSAASFASPAVATITLDGVQIYSGSITNAQVIFPYTFTNQKTLTITVSGASLTFSLWQITPTSNNTEILWIDNQKFLYRINHPVKTPTATYPVASNFDQQLTVFPTTAFTYIAISYLKTPTKPVYAFTQSLDRYVYDDTNSIDVEWPQELYDILMERTLANLGINMRSSEMIQYSNSQMSKEPLAK